MPRPIEVSIPLGTYARFHIQPPCGLASKENLIGPLDDPSSFYDAERELAGLLWFHSGSIEYEIANPVAAGSSLKSLELAVELCSDAPEHNNDWPSDITITINEREVGTWRSTGDYGGRRGSLTPAWWDTRDSQYGELTVWRVDSSGSAVNGSKVSDVTLQDLSLAGNHLISVGIGVKADAEHVGGLNLFGRCFGNHPQDLILRFTPA